MALQGDTIREYLTKYPDTPNLTLAKKIYKENKELFNSIEAVRSRVRAYKGKNGVRTRKRMASKEHYQDHDNPYNPFDDIPEGLKHFDDWKPYHIKGKKILVLGDVHIPYHDKTALITALKYGKDVGIDTFFILGDWFDFYSQSRFERDPRKRNTAMEHSVSVETFKVIRRVFPSIDIIFKKGNHDERHERYLKVKAPELLEFEVLDLEQLVNHGTSHKDKLDFGIKVVGDMRIVNIGKLNVVHGHEFGRSISSPVNPARGLYLRGQETAMCAHFHRASSHTETSMVGEVTVCWSIGCLQDMHPTYLPINKWNHGFAIVERDKNDFEVKNHTIINGKVY